MTMQFQNSSLSIEEKLKEHSTCSLYVATDSSDSKLMVKKFYTADSFNREVSSNNRLVSHPNILSFLGHVPEEKSCVFEHSEQGTLQQLLQQGPLKDDRIFQIMKDIITGLQYIHSLGIRHTSLDLSHIYLFQSGVKIGDFSDSESNDLRNLSSPIETDISSLHDILYELVYRDPPDQLGICPLSSSLFCNVLPKMKNSSLEDILKMISENTNKTSNLFSQIAHMFDKNTNGLIKAVTSESEQLASPMLTAKLIEKAWKKPFKVPKFYVKLSKRPSNKPTVALKTLALFHRYITRGPKVVFTSNPNLILEKIQRGWKPANQNFSDSKEYFRSLIYTYANILTQKLQLHMENRSFGSWQTHELIDDNGILTLYSFWSSLSDFTSLTMNNQHGLSEVICEVTAIMIEEESRLSKAILDHLLNSPPSEHLLELSETFQERHLSLLNTISSFNQKNPSTRLSDNDKALNALTDWRNTAKQPDGPAWLIRHEDILKQAVIGNGSSCTVYSGLYKSIPVAIKVLKEGQDKLEFNRELKVLSNLRHPNLVHFIGACFEPELIIVTELCHGDNLFSLLHQHPEIELSWPQRYKIAHDVAQGMNYLHSCNPPVIHRDLKSLNLLLSTPVMGENDPVCIKVSDFGVSRVVSEEEVMTGQMGTCHWMAPEVLASQPYSIPADVYSYGIVLWELAARTTPYAGINPALIPFQVLQGVRPDMSILKCSDDFKQLIVRCVQANPTDRPTFQQILSLFRVPT